MLTKARSTIAMTTAATIAVTAIGLTPAMAAPGSAAPKQALTLTDDATSNFVEVAKRRRHRHYNGGAAALGAFAAIAGTIATLAARDRYYRRHRYYEPYPYAYGYYGRPAPYGYYEPRYRYYRDW